MAKITLSSILGEALLEAKNADLPFGAAVIKRRGKGVKDSYVVMTLEQWISFHNWYGTEAV